jgi:hypothetical protein
MPAVTRCAVDWGVRKHGDRLGGLPLPGFGIVAELRDVGPVFTSGIDRRLPVASFQRAPTVNGDVLLGCERGRGRRRRRRTHMGHPDVG